MPRPLFFAPFRGLAYISTSFFSFFARVRAREAAGCWERWSCPPQAEAGMLSASAGSLPLESK